MSRGVARLGDKTYGDCAIPEHGPGIGGVIVSASPDCITNDRGVARLGDKVKADCGCESVIVSASSDTITNDRGTARLGDQVAGSPYTAVIVSASPDRLIN